jgi:hypothetical protein
MHSNANANLWNWDSFGNQQNFRFMCTLMMKKQYQMMMMMMSRRLSLLLQPVIILSRRRRIDPLCRLLDAGEYTA